MYSADRSVREFAAVSRASLDKLEPPLRFSQAHIRRAISAASWTFASSAFATEAAA